MEYPTVTYLTLTQKKMLQFPNSVQSLRKGVWGHNIPHVNFVASKDPGFNLQSQSEVWPFPHSPASL